MRDAHLMQCKKSNFRIYMEIKQKINEIFNKLEFIMTPELFFICLDDKGIYSIPYNYIFKEDIINYLKSKGGKPDTYFEIDKIKNTIFFSTGYHYMGQLDSIYIFIKIDKVLVESQKKIKFNEERKNTFIEEIIHKCLDICMDRLSGWKMSNNIYPTNIIKESSYDFIDKLLKTFNFRLRAREFIEDCNIISTMKYEGSEGSGYLLLKRYENILEDKSIRFEQNRDFRNYRMTRKLLEISDECLYLLSDGVNTYGFEKIDKEVLKNNILVEFIGNFEYKIKLFGNEIFRFKDGFPHISRESLDSVYISNRVKEIFNYINNDDLVNLNKIITAGTRQKHGTMIVISKTAYEEARRLKNQSITIKPLKIDETHVKSLTNIDGAIIIDEKCICYSIGVILDGKAENCGDSTRGARYNSALRYIYEHKNKCLIIVISEDGMVDIII